MLRNHSNCMHTNYFSTRAPNKKNTHPPHQFNLQPNTGPPTNPIADGTHLVKFRHGGWQFFLRDLLEVRPQLLDLELVSQRGPEPRMHASPVRLWKEMRKQTTPLSTASLSSPIHTVTTTTTGLSTGLSRHTPVTCIPHTPKHRGSHRGRKPQREAFHNNGTVNGTVNNHADGCTKRHT